MAVTKMKRLSLLAMNSDAKALLNRLQRLGCVQIERQTDEELEAYIKSEPAAYGELINRIGQAVRVIAPHEPKKKGLAGLAKTCDEYRIDSAVSEAEAGMDHVIGIVEKVEDNLKRDAEIRALISRVSTQRAQLEAWAGVDCEAAMIRGTRHSIIMLATFDPRKFDDFNAVTGERDLHLIVEEISRDRDGVHAFIAYHREDYDYIEPLLREAGCVQFNVTNLEGTIADNVKALEKQEQELRAEREGLDVQIAELVGELPAMRLLYDVLESKRDCAEASQLMLTTKSAFLMHGWVPEKREKEVAEAVKAISPSAVLEITEPEEGELPPVLLENPKWAKPFESIIEMFSLPVPGATDPTVMMAPFFVCFFGMMVSDAGYGIVLTIIAIVGIKLLKPRGTFGKIMGIMITGGLLTVFWGAMFGGWFSLEGIPPLLFAPMDKPLEMMILCLALGTVHLFVGVGMAAYRNFKRGDVMAALIDNLCWIMLIVGLVLLVLGSMIADWVTTTGMIMSAVSTGGIILFTKRDNKNIFKRILGGLGALYGISGYLSDILSYARLFGMGLATGVIGMVINTVVGMLMGNPFGAIVGIIIFIALHAFNMGINCLGAYVHSCRLQFIEFFGKFYESGGERFKPLELKPKFVDFKE